MLPVVSQVAPVCEPLDLAVVFNLGVSIPRRVVNHLWRGCKQIFYIHSFITFSFSKFSWGLLSY